MYKVQRKQTIKDTLVIENSAGEQDLVLEVSLHVDDIVGQYNRLRAMMGEAQAKLQKDPTNEESLAAYGYTVMALFSLVFGEDGASKLLDYYGNRYTEMLEDVAPFIVDRIQPQMQEAMKERAKKFRRMAGKIR